MNTPDTIKRIVLNNAVFEIYYVLFFSIKIVVINKTHFKTAHLSKTVNPNSNRMPTKEKQNLILLTNDKNRKGDTIIFGTTLYIV